MASILILLLVISPGRGLAELWQEAPLRVAVIGFAGSGAPEKALTQALARPTGVTVIERSQFQPALSGVGYDGSINMSTGEARGIGAAIGCDFFITGKAEVVTRSESKGQSHEEAIIGVMIVDGRGGALVLFDLIIEKAGTAEAALGKASEVIVGRAQSYAARMSGFRAEREKGQPVSGREIIEDLPDEGSARMAGFKPPEFLNRVKPEYTEEAERADITATVEAKALFRANGEVGEIEIDRWAGFGLDESAIRAIRQLKFKPATREGKPVSVRATVRYNFRRVSER